MTAPTTPPTSRELDDPRLRTALLAVAGSGLALALGAVAFAGPSAGLSALLGAGLAVGNLWALAKIVTALLPRDASGAGAQSRAAWGFMALIKLSALVAITWLIMRHGWATPLPLLVGFFSLPMGIAIGSLVSDRTAV